MRERFGAMSALAIACAMVLAACSGGDDETPTTVEGPEPSGDEATVRSSPERSGNDAAQGSTSAVEMRPSGTLHPDPELTLNLVPGQPENLLDYGPTAVTWLQGKTDADEIRPLLDVWQTPAAPVTFEGLGPLALIDTDSDGRASVVIVFSDRNRSPDLVVFDPVPGEPGHYQIAYDSVLATGEEVWGYIAVLSVDDRSGDAQPDIVFLQHVYGNNNGRDYLHLLTRDGAGYRDLAAPEIWVWGARNVDTRSDVTGDGLPELSLVGGESGTNAWAPDRWIRHVFSASGGALKEVLTHGLSSEWLVFALVDGNALFAKHDWAGAVLLYNEVLNDPRLRESNPGTGEAAELRALANLRKSIALAQTGDAVGAAAAARALAAGTGVVAEAGAAYLTSFASSGDVGAACAAFEGALSMARWDEFWSHYGYAVPRLEAEALCPG